MKKICVISTSRADYYLLSLICKKIKLSKKLKLYFIASGDHFIINKGYSYRDILKDGFKIDFKIPSKHRIDSRKSIISNFSDSLRKYQKAFSKINPHLILLLGDRFEIMSPALTALIYGIPIAHIHGGEVTEGAIDDSVRHSLTKISNIHFVCNEIYKKRVQQLGENSKMVFNVGGIGADIIKNESLLNKKDLEYSLKININKKVILVTIHPETKNNDLNKFKHLFDALKKFTNNYLIIFTNPNSDFGYKFIDIQIRNFTKNYGGYYYINLGRKNYLSLLKYSTVIVGNSSSGILEAPVLRTPTINLGNRQKGREFSKSIYSTEFNNKKITGMLKKILRIKKFNYFSPYKSKNASKIIVNKLETIETSRIIKKKFYDI